MKKTAGEIPAIDAKTQFKEDSAQSKKEFSNGKPGETADHDLGEDLTMKEAEEAQEKMTPREEL